MKRFVIDDATQTILNVILVDPGSLPTMPTGQSLLETGGNIGDVWNGTEWVAVTPDPAEALAAERAAMVCSRKQGKLAIGPATWAGVEALLADMEADPLVSEATTWALRVAVYDSQVWERLDQDMAALIWAMGLTDEQADDLFRLAVTL